MCQKTKTNKQTNIEEKPNPKNKTEMKTGSSHMLAIYQTFCSIFVFFL